jgi:hypothetical protein
VFSDLRASFVKRQAFKPLNRCAEQQLVEGFKPFKQFKYPLPCGCQINFGPFGVAQDRFWIPTNQRSNLKNHLAMCRFDTYFAFDLLAES